MKPCEREKNPARRIALFGGTFNPIHRGHLQAALDVLAQFRLELIYFIPSALPPHKRQGQLASARERLTMVELALSGHARLLACDVEIQRQGPSYSIDTVRHFQEAASPDGRIYFMVGLDAFMEIHTWRAFDLLFAEAAFIVMSRPGSGQWTPEMRRQVASYVQQRISPAYRLDDEAKYLAHPALHEIHLASVTPVAVASSQIRDLIRQGRSITSWVAPAVAEYIAQRGLYR